MTECTHCRFEFAGPGRRTVVARFDGGTMSSDGGALLLQQTERRLRLLARAAGCFQDGRKAVLIQHRVEELLAQRVYGLALGYEDLTDHDQLRRDPLLALERQEASGRGAAGGQEHAEPPGAVDSGAEPL